MKSKTLYCSEPAEEVYVESVQMREHRLIREFITFSPNKFTRILPHHTGQFIIKFSPTERMQTFTEKVLGNQLKYFIKKIFYFGLLLDFLSSARYNGNT